MSYIVGDLVLIRDDSTPRIITDIYTLGKEIIYRCALVNDQVNHYKAIWVNEPLLIRFTGNIYEQIYLF